MRTRHAGEKTAAARPSRSAITRDLEMLLFVARAPKPVTAGEVAAGTGASRTTAYRTLEALHRDGWLRASGTPRCFAPSLRVAELGIAALRNHQIRDVLLPHAIELARLTQHYCYLAFYEDGDVLYTDTVVIFGERVFPTLSGNRFPAPVSAAGKVLLAHQPADEIARVLRREIPQRTPLTHTDPHLVRQDLRQCLERGYGINDGELEHDSVGVAAPVFDAQRTVVAALGVNAVVPFRGEVGDLARQAVAAAAHASLELGFRPSLGEHRP